MQAHLFFLCIRIFFVADLSPPAANFAIESFVSSINFIYFILSRNLNDPSLQSFSGFSVKKHFDMIFYGTYLGCWQMQNYIPFRRIIFSRDV